MERLAVPDGVNHQDTWEEQSNKDSSRSLGGERIMVPTRISLRRMIPQQYGLTKGLVFMLREVLRVRLCCSVKGGCYCTKGILKST